jgi:hypothetical protein
MVSKAFIPKVSNPADEVRILSAARRVRPCLLLAIWARRQRDDGAGLALRREECDFTASVGQTVSGRRHQRYGSAAHKFADEIIFRLGGGILGIAGKIYFVSSAGTQGLGHGL